MSLTTDGFWKAGFWSTTFWADGFWYEVGGGAPVIISGLCKLQHDGLSEPKELEAYLNYQKELP